MPNTITKTLLANGPRNLIVHCTIVGDGSGEESAAVLINRSDYVPVDGLELKLRKVYGHLTGFSAVLLFDASTDLAICHLPDGEMFKYEWGRVGGISSAHAGTGYNGDILITTASLGNGDRGTFTLEMTKN